MSTTIRRNATKRISNILNSCEFLRVFKYDDMGGENGEVTAAEVIAAGEQFEFDRVYLDESGCIHCVIHRNWSYTGYPTLELARDKMTAPAVAKYRIAERIASRQAKQETSQDEEDSSEVAQIILQQLGGARFRLMTGAKNFLAIKNGLQFKLPSTPNYTRDGINSVRIMLNVSDLYDIQFHRVRGTSVKLIKELSDVFCEVLQEIFTEYTGLDTHL